MRLLVKTFLLFLFVVPLLCVKTEAASTKAEIEALKQEMRRMQHQYQHQIQQLQNQIKRYDNFSWLTELISDFP